MVLEHEIIKHYLIDLRTESHTHREKGQKRKEKYESIIITDFFYLKQKRSRLKIDPEQRLSQFVLQMYF